MQRLFQGLYTLMTALWVGGISIFTFIVTPLIFKSYGRDMAGEIVGKLFHGYFLYNLVLAGFALALFLLIAANRSRTAYKVSVVCLVSAVLINLFIFFKLYPDTVKVKQQVASFERETSDSPARKQFGKLHGVSAVLNLCLLAEGIALILVDPNRRKND